MKRGGTVVSTHRRCRFCGRLLCPKDDGTLPPHRVPVKTKYGRKQQPLTGVGNPWCRGSDA
jgi:hypothetical protein